MKLNQTTVKVKPMEVKTNLASTVMNNTYSICGTRIASVPVECMALDFSYQRLLGKTIQKLMVEWDHEQCRFLEVSYRDGKFYIIDGQHRYSVAKAKGIDSLPCIIYTGLTRREEALRFARQQDNVNKLTNYDTFKANIACGDESIPAVKIDMEIKRICDKYGIIVSSYSPKGKCCLRCLYDARLDTKAFKWIMETINMSNWAKCCEAYQSRIYRALESYYKTYKDMKDVRNKLIELMNSTSPKDLKTMANYEFDEYNQGAALRLCIMNLTYGKAA